MHLASIADVTPPPPTPGHPLPTLTEELDRLACRLDEPSPIPVRQVQRAKSTIADVRQELARPNRLRLLHNDCHFLNVLSSGRPDGPPWVAIDPLPVVGISEWELTPLLRNRFPDATATGDPDRALRRRVDQVADHVPIDRELTRACAQLCAVASLHHLLPEHSDHLHAPAYQVMATW